ncbi:MAG: response regulator transcription factor [Treponema sp.]|nr:response regulator transcription factor [Treponema sp.]
MINIILVSSDVRVKEEISSIITSHKDLVLQGLGKDIYDAITMVRKHRPDIVLLDADLISNDGLEICNTLKRNSPASAIAMISTSVRDFLIHGIVSRIFNGCLLKDSDMNQLVKILRKIYLGEHYVNSKIIARAYEIIADYFKGTAAVEFITKEKKFITRPIDFSNSELDVLRLVTKGHNTKEIARSLYLKDGTVRNYLSSIMHKAGVSNRTQMVLYAQQYGLAKKE